MRSTKTIRRIGIFWLVPVSVGGRFCFAPGEESPLAHYLTQILNPLKLLHLPQSA